MESLGRFAVDALVDEATLTPKPALVDARSSGVHRDLDLPRMLRSAASLRPTFDALAREATGRSPSQRLRERLAHIGRCGEEAMLAATGGSNSHRGAIWIVGLLVAGAAMRGAAGGADGIAKTAAAVAQFPDRLAPHRASNGARACARFGVAGARGEAHAGFPHAVRIGLPALHAARARGVAEANARLDALMAIMAHIDDTCLLHRGGQRALDTAKMGARRVLAGGGTSRPEGRRALDALDAELVALRASPGGAADMLAATLFLDRCTAWKH
ncbi:triphosphoribosyl-dephospho-CoA synthase [Pendulispora brunnea]|uniref:triphosphoribosyl-dephospho-CoA synthase n=1 Tax=Pendulispora brunnea TaxID=2905690 RepID=A0ABZ2KL79_9BACT